jgi:hypothetical protein
MWNEFGAEFRVDLPTYIHMLCWRAFPEGAVPMAVSLSDPWYVIVVVFRGEDPKPEGLLPQGSSDAKSSRGFRSRSPSQIKALATRGFL